MDVHRARFVPFPSFAVSAVAFSRSSDSEDDVQPDLKLAIGRQDGSIEIWNPISGRWTQEIVLHGADSKSVDGLVWIRGEDESRDGIVTLGQQRLFSISGSPAVTEWDLTRAAPKKPSSGNFSEVWCFAAQPRASADGGNGEVAESQDLVAGCADGTLVILSTKDDDLQFQRVLARVSGKKTRCLSVTYQHRDRVVAGFTDGTLRIYDAKKDTCLRTMSLGASLPGSPKNIYVWQVKCLPTGDVVTGDSSGNITIWNGRSYSISQRITAHDTDCLDIVTSSDGKSIYSGSIEGRVAVIRNSPSLSGKNMWTKQSHRKIHDGDVKCMTAFDAKDMSVIVSGGSDMKAIVTPLRDYGRASSHALPHLPQRPSVTSARHARLLVSWWDKTVSIWRMSRKPGLELDPQPPRKLVAKLTLDTKADIESVCITEDGRLLAVATRAEVKVFQLRKRLDDAGLAIRKVDLPRDLASLSSHVVAFSPDGKWLAAVSDSNDLQVARIVNDASNSKRLQVLDQVVELERRTQPATQSRGFNQYDRTVVRITFSSDSNILATADLAGYIDSWTLEGHEDAAAPAVGSLVSNSTTKASEESDSDSSDDHDEPVIFYGQHWMENPRGHLLPKLESVPLVFTFRPQVQSKLANGQVNGDVHHGSNGHSSHQLTRDPQHLFVMTAKHQIHEFDVVAGHSSSWGRRNHASMLPTEFRKQRDRVMGSLWDVTRDHQRLWLYGNSWMLMLNVAGDLATPTLATKVDLPSHNVSTSKRRPSGREDAPGTITITAEFEDTPNKRRRVDGPSRQPAYREGLAGTAKRYEKGNVTTFDLDARGTAAAHGGPDEDEEDEAAGAFVRAAQLRRAQQEPNVDRDQDDNEDADDHDQDENHVNGDGPQSRGALVSVDPSAQQATSDCRFWHTTRYRSILGVVPLGDFGVDEADGSIAQAGALVGGDEGVLEAVVVERPLETVP
jgi:U3 small nucleolar RNA-associated protein 4